MRNLKHAEVCYVGGATLSGPGYSITVPSNGIPLNHYLAIDAQFQLVLDGKQSFSEAKTALSSSGVTNNSLMSYYQNLDSMKFSQNLFYYTLTL